MASYNYSFSLDSILNSGSTGSGVLTANYSDFSVSIWVRTTASGVICGNRNLGDTIGGWVIALSGSNVVFEMHQLFSSTYSITTTSGFLDGNWHNIVGTYDSVSGALLYVDGSLQTVTTSGSPGMDISSARTICLGSAAGSGSFIGNTVGYRFWNVILSPTDVSTINSGGDPVASPLGYWREQEDTGLTLNDSSGNNYTITASGGSWHVDVPPVFLITLLLSLSDSQTSSDSVQTVLSGSTVTILLIENILEVADSEGVTTASVFSDSITTGDWITSDNQSPGIWNS